MPEHLSGYDKEMIALKDEANKLLGKSLRRDESPPFIPKGPIDEFTIIVLLGAVKEIRDQNELSELYNDLQDLSKILNAMRSLMHNEGVAKDKKRTPEESEYAQFGFMLDTLLVGFEAGQRMAPAPTSQPETENKI